MNKLHLFRQDGVFVVDSREVAIMVGRNHKDLLENIRTYNKHLVSGKFRPSNFFIESSYRDSQNRVKPCYLITKKGCDMVANKMTGEKGVHFSAAYVEKFEEMEKELNNPRVLTESEQLRASIKLSLEATEEIGEIKEEVHTLKNRFDNELTLKHAQAQALQHAIRKRIERLFADGVMGVLETKQQMYSKIHSQLRRAFQSPTYREVKRVDFDEAMQWVSAWRPM